MSTLMNLVHAFSATNENSPFVTYRFQVVLFGATSYYMQHLAKFFSNITGSPPQLLCGQFCV